MSTANSRRKLKIGAIYAGVGGGGGGSAAELWRHPDVPIDASVNIDWYIKQARQAEAALLVFVFVTDSQYIETTYTQHHLNRLEPLTLLAAVATHTKHIGLAATASTTYAEPFEIARRFSSLDQISGGRSAWNVVTSYDSGTAGNFSRSAHGGHEARYARGTESVAVVKGLWDSYEDGAFAQSKTAESYLDTTKIHRLNHVGEFFSVTGPLNVQRSIQGQPVIIQAGTSGPGRQLNAAVSDVAFSFARTQEWALEFKRDVQEKASVAGRNADDILFIPALSVRIRETDELAHEAEREALFRRPLDKQLDRLRRQHPGTNFDSIDLDAPVSTLETASAVSAVDDLYRTAIQNNWTWRQFLQSGAYHNLHIIGSPQTVANEIESWYRSEAADGFNVFAGEPEDFIAFLEQVIPILQERGIFRTEYEGTTLRENLELSVPVNRYTQHSAAVSAV